MTGRNKARVRLAQGVVSRELDGEMVLLNLTTGVYFGLNESGTAMWKLLAELKNPSRIVDALAEDFQASRLQLEEDLSAFLAALREKGLIEDEDTRAA